MAPRKRRRGGPGNQGQHQLQSSFRARLDYMKPFQKTQQASKQANKHNSKPRNQTKPEAQGLPCLRVRGVRCDGFRTHALDFKAVLYRSNPTFEALFSCHLPRKSSRVITLTTRGPADCSQSAWRPSSPAIGCNCLSLSVHVVTISLSTVKSLGMASSSVPICLTPPCVPGLIPVSDM